MNRFSPFLKVLKGEDLHFLNINPYSVTYRWNRPLTWNVMALRKVSSTFLPKMVTCLSRTVERLPFRIVWRTHLWICTIIFLLCWQLKQGFTQKEFPIKIVRPQFWRQVQILFVSPSGEKHILNNGAVWTPTQSES